MARWATLFSALVVGLLLIPFVLLFFSLDPSTILGVFSGWWSEAAFNTYTLATGTVLCSLLFGIPAAWFVSRYTFAGRSILEGLLVLPLAIPGYIQAYTYKGLLDPFGTTAAWFNFYLEVDQMGYLMVILGSVLYPYIYLAARTAFLAHSSTLYQAGLSLRANPTRVFWRIVIPLARPAIIGGVMLVVMEVFNNYGAVSYYGIQTFSTEVVRLWNPMNLQPVIRIAISVILLVLLIMYLEKKSRSRAAFHENKGRSIRVKLEGNWRKTAVYSALFTPLLVGFIIPVAQLMYWATMVYAEVLTDEFWRLVVNTASLALAAAFISLGIAVLIHYTNGWVKSQPLARWTSFARIGYAIPGAVVGVAMLLPLAYLSKWSGVLLTGSLVTLTFAYAVRFQTVAYQAVESGFNKLSPNLLEAARSLRSSFSTGLFKVYLPLSIPALSTAILLVFVDVMKELPLTMLFQSFNFETLAVRAFKLMETDGAVYDSAVPSLLIIGLGLLPVVLLNRIAK